MRSSKTQKRERWYVMLDKDFEQLKNEIREQILAELREEKTEDERNIFREAYIEKVNDNIKEKILDNKLDVNIDFYTIKDLKFIDNAYKNYKAKNEDWERDKNYLSQLLNMSKFDMRVFLYEQENNKKFK